MSPHARLGFGLAFAILVLDQASKLWLLFGVRLAEYGPFRLTPFMDFVLAWNRGISYGLFQQYSDLGRWALVVISFAAALWLGNWLRRAETRIASLGLGLIIGGAVGNGIDRAVYGAVVDFVHLHAFGWSWYIFNLADAAIVVGVVALMYDTLRNSPGKPART